MMKIVKDALVQTSCLLGESPIWDPDTECLYWIDIISGQLHRFYEKNQLHEVLNFDKALCAIARCSNGQLIIAFKKELGILKDFHIDDLTTTTALLHGNEVRFNDGKVDPNGMLWLGSMSELGLKNEGVLMRIDATFKAKIQMTNLGTSNGMCWSPDLSVFYHIDTMQQHVKSYSYSTKTGIIKNEKIIIQIPKELGKPDGMTIDDQGKLWIALWGGWAVSRWDPIRGICIGMIKLPVSQVTSCTFGGENLSELFITTASIGLTNEQNRQQPLAGSVFKVSLPDIKGLPAFNFKL